MYWMCLDAENVEGSYFVFMRMHFRICEKASRSIKLCNQAEADVGSLHLEGLKILSPDAFQLREIINLLVQDFLWTFPEIYTFVPWNQSLVLTIMISPVKITLRHFYSSTLCERESTWIKCGFHSWMAGGGTFRRRAQVPSLHAANLSLDIVDKSPLRVTFWFLQGNIGAFSQFSVAFLYLAGPHPPGWNTQN